MGAMSTADLCTKNGGHGRCPRIALNEANELTFCVCKCHIARKSSVNRKAVS